MTSSIDPRGELAAVLSRLSDLPEACYDGIDQDFVLPIDAFGNKEPYRDIQPGSTIPSSSQRMVAAGEQAQPHIWAFQVEHVASSRQEAFDMAVATDLSLIGWAPTVNASTIKTFFFTVYDQSARGGERLQWIATRFYETTLGQEPDFSL